MQKHYMKPALLALLTAMLSLLVVAQSVNPDHQIGSILNVTNHALTVDQ